MLEVGKIEAGKIYETAEAVFSEEDLILGILWEGDLEIHSNMEMMKADVFGERIVHGDSVAAKAIGLIMNSACFKGAARLDLKRTEYSFLSPVFIEDRLGVSFVVDSKEHKDETKEWQFKIKFEVFKSSPEVKTVSKGEIFLTAA